MRDTAEHDDTAADFGDRINLALAFAGIDRPPDWVVDQMVRALTGCPWEAAERVNADGEPYDSYAQGESAAYREWIAEHPHKSPARQGGNS